MQSYKNSRMLPVCALYCSWGCFTFSMLQQLGLDGLAVLFFEGGTLSLRPPTYLMSLIQIKIYICVYKYMYMSS